MIKQITNYYNFEYQSKGLLIQWSQLNRDQSIINIISSGTEGFTHNWVQTKEKFDVNAMDVDDCDPQEEQSLDASIEQKNIYEYDVEEVAPSNF